MGKKENKASGFYDILTLEDAKPGQLTEFNTSGWAGLDVLYDDNHPDYGILAYPHIADPIGYLPDWGNDVDHPLRGVGKIMSSTDVYPLGSWLTNLSFQVGHIACSDRKKDFIAGWERNLIAERFDQLDDLGLAKPKGSWTKAEFVKYYREIRGIQAEILRKKVTELAGQIVLQNVVEQLYVAQEYSEDEGSGLLAPLVGLTIDTSKRNSYRDNKVHDILPVVKQKDGQNALLREAIAGLYTVDPRRMNSHSGQ